ncbi:hypothetical protein SO802_022002 [Lithocarpus litseifolius]|uniref:MIP18 family-like domain-containing protein n=1 Tax=Lithocarpus litseifolius TaxID=425828 RepID=A0AAW2CHR0_9ROSI
MVSELINANPIVYEKKERRPRSVPTAVEEYAVEPIDQQEVFDILSLQLFWITFTPTVEHCSMATIIGLCLRVKLLRSLPSRYKVDIRVAPGSHASESAAMDSNSSSTLVLCGKSTAENEIALSLKSNKTLKLPGDSEVSVLWKSELEKPLEENSFRIDSYMGSLSTSQFGTFLIWSPRLPSTHNVVSQ